MHNFTLLSLNLLSLASRSPFYTITQNDFKKTSLILNSYFSRSFSTIIYSENQRHSSSINGNTFSHMLNTPVIFTSRNKSFLTEDWQIYYEGICNQPLAQCCPGKDIEFKKNMIIKDLEITANSFTNVMYQRNVYFYNGCGNLKISKCKFLSCYTTDDYGGGILVRQSCEIILHNCIFDHCHSKLHGAGGAIATEFAFTGKDPTLTDTIKLDIQYTCFQYCYQTTSNEGFGSALLMAANDVTFFYASTTNDNSNDHKAYGAQFDIKAERSISSQYVNATGGCSEYCGAMEYRSAITGFFRYQTLMKMRCKFVTSFTSVDINNLVIHSCNVNDNVVSAANEDKSNNPALIYVRDKDLKVENFYFFRNTLNDNGKFAQRNVHGNQITITLLGCYADTDQDWQWKQDYVVTIDCHFSNPIEKTFPLRQLNLGSCQGDITPGQMIISPTFTPTSEFTPSSVYTKSDVFSISHIFSDSKMFSPSFRFSKSEGFTKTDGFSKTGEFSKTNAFSKTGVFSESTEFSMSFEFTPSSPFTSSYKFDQTHYFTPSKTFTPSIKFSKSSDFTYSSEFTFSGHFSESFYFTNSKQFSESNEFTKTVGFSDSVKFTKSVDFTESTKFSRSDYFTKSDEFSQTSEFTMSSPFTMSSAFTRTNEFSLSSDFSPSEELLVDRNVPAAAVDDNKSNKGVLIGAIVGSIAGAAIIAAIAFFIWWKKRPSIAKDSANVVGDAESSITVDNALATVMDEDDPFAGDFRDELADIK